MIAKVGSWKVVQKGTDLGDLAKEALVVDREGLVWSLDIIEVWERADIGEGSIE